MLNIPNELKLLPNWVGYKLLNGSKVPVNLKTGDLGKSNDSSTWCSFQQAISHYKQRGCEGIGFCFEPPYIGIDLDDAIEGGQINEFGRQIIQSIDSYTEISPSGTGVHIICKGTLPKAYKTEKIEIYTTGRFFTVTGNVVDDRNRLFNRSDKVAELIPKENRESNPQGWIGEALQGLQEGNRNNTFAKVVGKLHRDKWGKADILGLLTPKAEEVGFAVSELQAVVESVTRYQVADEIIKEANNQDEEESQHISKFLEDIKPVEWLIPSVIAKNSINFICGLQETCKTWMLIDLAIEAAKGGGYWLGKFPVQDCKVLYIDQERAKNETQRRFLAVTKAKHLNIKELHLDIKWGSTITLNLQPSYEAFKRTLIKYNSELVLIDSFSTFHSKDDSSKQEMQEILEKIKSLRNELGCTFVFIDHENKLAYNEEEATPSMKTLAGSAAKPRVLEGALTLRKHAEGESMVYHTKNTQGSKIEPFLVRVEDLKPDKSEISVKAY